MNYKNILMILILIVVTEVGWLVWRVPQLKKLQSQAEIQEIQGKPETQGGVVKEEKEVEGKVTSEEEIEEGARLWLEPNEGEFSGQFNIDIFVQTSNPIDGLDARLFYPKDKLMIVDQDSQKEDIQVSVGKFDDYPINKVDEEQGLILLSGIILGKSEEVAPLDQPFLVGRVTFKTITSGQAELSFEFEPGSSKDSNVAETETAKDILKEVEGAILTLK